ncbi:MAG: rod shape-determining protein [Rhodocyclales bacterium]|nr:rod shape-determining protein [Rhodocyclales bacterium]
MPLARLLTTFFDARLYVQIAPDRLTVRNPKTGKQVSDVAEIALARGTKPRLLAVGHEARAAARQGPAEIIKPFAHPRSLVSDFTAAEQLLKAFMAKLQTPGIFAVAPSVVMHPLGDPEGGFTQIEVRAIQELALGAGARAVKVWQGRPLTDHELMTGQFPATGAILN